MGNQTSIQDNSVNGNDKKMINKIYADLDSYFINATNNIKTKKSEKIKEMSEKLAPYYIDILENLRNYLESNKLEVDIDGTFKIELAAIVPHKKFDEAEYFMIAYQVKSILSKLDFKSYQYHPKEKYITARWN